MPTIGIYVPMETARLIAARWHVDVKGEEFAEVVRNLTADSLHDASGAPQLPPMLFDVECRYEHLHHSGFRCRHCGGSS